MRTRGVILGGLAAMALAAPPAAGAAAPKVQQLVVFRDGPALQKTVGTRHASVERPRAALRRRRRHGAGGARSEQGRGGCGCATSAPARRGPRDSAGLLVTGIGPDRNRGQRGWVYKVGRRAATAGAGDTGGPFGRGRLRRGPARDLVLLRARGRLPAHARVEDEPDGRRRRRDACAATTTRATASPVEGASVTAAGVTGLTGADGRVQLALPSGTHRLVARKDGLVRSFSERVEVP